MLRMISAAVLAAVCGLAGCAPADARPHRDHQGFNYDADGRTTQRLDDHRRRRSSYSQSRMRSRADHAASRPRAAGLVIGGRPAGCPHRYCGCGTSLKIFGRIRPELNLASNWLRKFPRTVPAPGMVAARTGHVMVLLEQVAGDEWRVWDANSGDGLTRIHVRSIRGFGVVNPHAAGLAATVSTAGGG